jgi:hypothetical protein
MKLTVCLQRIGARVNLSTVVFIALLQRAPILRLVAAADEFVTATPVSALLRSAAMAAATLGAVNSMAGATTLVTTLTPNPNGNLPPFQADVGVPITPLGFTITPLITIGSWKISGVIPPGLSLTTVQPNGGNITGPAGGLLDATTSTNTLTTPILEGTPTVAGTYMLTFQGFWYGGESGGPTGKGISSLFPFTIIVSDSSPVFTMQPLSVTVTGGTVALNALAMNASAYQWMWNGSTTVAGATSPILLISDAAAAAGTYTCVASNVQGSTSSNPATVSVATTKDVGRLINISTRSEVGTGSSIQIAGFVIGGQGTAGTEPLLIRASGPALTPLGVSGALPDPQLQLFSGSTLNASNNGWLGKADITAAAAAVGAFPWTDPTSHDSALLLAPSEGAYTAQISGASNDTGVALIELYDNTPAGTYTPSDPRLVNISARVWVGTGGDILIAGFVIGGTTAKTVLVRASGPALVPFGVTDTLPDPQLTLYSGNTVLASSRGWGGVSEIANTAAAVGAFAWTDPNSSDSALLITLPPGAYTAQIAGASGDTGVALVELYDVP